VKVTRQQSGFINLARNWRAGRECGERQSYVRLRRRANIHGFVSNLLPTGGQWSEPALYLGNFKVLKHVVPIMSEGLLTANEVLVRSVTLKV